MKKAKLTEGPATAGVTSNRGKKKDSLGFSHHQKHPNNEWGGGYTLSTAMRETKLQNPHFKDTF